MLQSNTSFTLLSKINITDTTSDTFTISNENENDTPIDTDGEQVSIVFSNKRQRERLIVTIVNNVCTIVSRGLSQKGGVASTALQKQWLEGTVGYITALDFDIFEKDSGEKQIVSADVQFDGNVDAKTISVIGSNYRIRKDGTDMKFRDDNQSEITLSALAAASGSDEKIKISNNDTTAGYLNGKLVAGDGISFTENNNGLNETLDVDVDVTDTTTFVKISSGASDENKIPVLNASGKVDDFVSKVSNFQKTLTAGENLASLSVYRKGKTSLSEDTSKFYQSKANNTNKLDFEGITVSSALTDNTFDGTFNGVVGGFTSLIGRDILGVSGQESMTLTTHNYPATNRLGNTFQVDYANSRISEIIVRTGSSVTGTAYIEILDSGNNVIGTSNTISISGTGDKTFAFSPGINTSSGNTYHFNIVSASGSIPAYTYAQAGNYPNGQLVIGNTLQNAAWDLYFIVNYNEIDVSEIGSSVYLQDDGILDVNAGTNTVVVGHIYSDTEIKILESLSNETSTSATTGAVVLGNAEGYIIVNIPGLGNKKIPYYGI